ncbi:zinc finger matrin-type protein 2-like [Salvia divinorum]|uniref:Zinc finger matrin-type protein 2-like n=1 Tax=Salvia divinorum TaxID=28513 RepID=A0ABD1GPC8_SALDI
MQVLSAITFGRILCKSRRTELHNGSIWQRRKHKRVFQFHLHFLWILISLTQTHNFFFFLLSVHAAGIDNTFRKQFDREEYLQRARDREAKEEARNKSKSSGPPVQRKPLKHRYYEVNLESRLGKTQVLFGQNRREPLSQQAGYYCSVCECVVKDSANYLDHINGKMHQRAMGMSMRSERATLEQVEQRFEVLKKRKDTPGFTEQEREGSRGGT